MPAIIPSRKQEHREPELLFGIVLDFPCTKTGRERTQTWEQDKDGLDHKRGRKRFEPESKPTIRPLPEYPEQRVFPSGAVPMCACVRAYACVRFCVSTQSSPIFPILGYFLFTPAISTKKNRITPSLAPPPPTTQNKRPLHS